MTNFSKKTCTLTGLIHTEKDGFDTFFLLKGLAVFLGGEIL